MTGGGPDLFPTFPISKPEIVEFSKIKFSKINRYVRGEIVLGVHSGTQKI